MEKYICKNKKSQGSILIFSVLILGAVLSITFAILGIFMPKLKISADPIKSSIAAFAADAGAEWCLYVNQGKPSPPSRPVLEDNPVGSEIMPTYIIYAPSSGADISNCSEAYLDHRIVGSYRDVARSFEIHGKSSGGGGPPPPPPPPPSAIAFVQDNGATITAAPFQVVYSSNITAGHLLTAVITLNSNTITITGVTDTLGSVWQRAKRQAHATSATATEIWYAMNSGAGANTVSINFSSAPANVQVGIHEWSGVATVGALDQTNGQDNNDIAGHGAGGIASPSVNSLVIFGLRTTSAFNIVSIPTGFNNLEPQNPRGRAYYKIKTDSLAEDPILTFDALEISAAAMATFKAP